MKGRKVTVFEGTGRLDADQAGRASSTGTTPAPSLKGTNVILAAGSVPRTLPGFDVDGKIVVTSDEFLTSQRCRPARR